jgi:elongation factor P--(R)-beta-lysine ligase
LTERARRGLPGLPMDRALLQALEHGLPAVAGVALGFDRVLMLRLGARSLDQVLAFPLDRA